MSILRKATLAIAAALVCPWSALGEQIPAGTYANTFQGTAALYDLSGTYAQSLSGIGLNCTLNMDSNGKLSGAGSAALGDSTTGVGGNVEVTFTGTVKSSQDVTRVTMNVKMTGNIVGEGTSVKFSANMKENLEIAPGGRAMTGTVSGSVRASVPGYGSKTVKMPATPISLALPAGETGAWSLTLNLAPSKNKYTGTATATMANGTSHPLTVTGSYSGKSDTSKLTFKGERGIAFSLVTAFQNAGIEFQTLKGKALGQSPHTP